MYVSIERIAAIKKRTAKQNAMRGAFNVIASNNLLCEIVSRSGCEYCISMLLIFQILFRIHLVSVIKCY